MPDKSELYADVALKSYSPDEVLPVIQDWGFDVEACDKTLGYEDQGRKIMYWEYLLRKRSQG